MKKTIIFLTDEKLLAEKEKLLTLKNARIAEDKVKLTEAEKAAST